MTESTFEEAVSYIDERIGGGYGIGFGHERQFNYIIPQLIEEEVPFSCTSVKISEQTVGYKLKELLIDAKKENWDYSEFQTEVEDYSTELFKSRMTHYTVVFALNLRDFQPIPDSFSILDLEITRIDRTDWEDYKDLAKEQEEVLEEFFNKPQVLQDEDEFTFWKCSIEANDAGYASYLFQQAIEALLGKILFAFKKRHLFGGTRSDDLPSIRGSWLSKPQISLYFDSDTFEYSIPDYDYQEPTTIPLAVDEIETRFRAIPNLDTETNYDNKLQTAFRLYYYSVTAKQRQNSYFTLLRGIEYLSQKENQQPFQLSIDRALFAHSLVGEGSLPPWFEDALENFDAKRNAIAHEGPHTPLQRTYQDLAKVLFEDLITVYLLCYDNFSVKEVGDMLKYGLRETNKEESQAQFSEIDSPHLED